MIQEPQRELPNIPLESPVIHNFLYFQFLSRQENRIRLPGAARSAWDEDSSNLGQGHTASR